MGNLIPSKSKSASSNNGDLAIRNGFPAIHQMRQELDQVFQRFFGDFSFLGNDKCSWGIDMEEKEDSVIARFEAPGFDLKDVELKQIGNELVFKAEHKSETKDKDSSKECCSSVFRSITLPQGCAMEKAEAKFHNGLLTVAIPKNETTKGKKIAIQAN